MSTAFEQAWLDYRPLTDTENGRYFRCIVLPEAFAEPGGPGQTAAEELAAAGKALYGVTAAVQREAADGAEGCIRFLEEPSLAPEGYALEGTEEELVIRAGDGAGCLYGAFALIRSLRCGDDVLLLAGTYVPGNPLRMLNHWDNSDGSIERGYSGRSFFFKDSELLVDERTRAYARLIASTGINAVVINNVNVKAEATWLITERYFDRLRELLDILHAYAIKLYVSINFTSPMEIGGLPTCDPLDEGVQAWWKNQVEKLYAALPGFGGFLVKADSEGRPGPFTYGRNHAEGANLLARALAPFGGTLIWRCFVYNCTQDWRDRKTDRARSAYDTFLPLDGQFDDNVILQIKNGPMDFQVREPVLPLFGALTKTRQMLEVQIAQEYTGQQIHLCYLIPWFKQVLDFHTYHPQMRRKDTVADIISGRALPGFSGGMAAVANTGDDENWTGHDLAAANLYGFGRLSFDPRLTAEEIAQEWIRQTYGEDVLVQETLLSLLMQSWPTYEHYTAPLGIGWMVNPNHHYGPNVDGYEYDRWGTYHRSDCHGMGVDRTARGTNYAACYNPPLSQIYANPLTCPDELILFFHHLPYLWQLQSGKTIIQHIYDTHFAGAAEAAAMRKAYEALKGHIPDKAFDRTLRRFLLQEESAKEWRDRINTYYRRISGIDDEQGRTIY